MIYIEVNRQRQEEQEAFVKRHGLHRGPREHGFIELEVWFLNCVFGFVGATLHLQQIVPTGLNWQGILLSLSFFLWVVNLTRRIRIQFKSKFKREYCFPSRFCCEILFSLWTTSLSARHLHFPSSGLQFGGCTPGYLVLVSSRLSGSRFLPHFMRGLRSERTHGWKQVCDPPPDALQAWAPSLSSLLQV